MKYKIKYYPEYKCFFILYTKKDGWFADWKSGPTARTYEEAKAVLVKLIATHRGDYEQNKFEGFEEYFNEDDFKEIK